MKESDTLIFLAFLVLEWLFNNLEMQVSVMEQKKEVSEEVDDEIKPSDNAVRDPPMVASKDDGTDGKPDVSDAPVEETQVMIELFPLV